MKPPTVAQLRYLRDDAVPTRPGETTGYASRRPRDAPPGDRAMSAQAGQRVELRRYRISAGERALFAQRIDGRVAVVDVPVDHDERVYLVERHVPSHAELSGLCAAYAEHSEHADRPAIVAQRDLLDDLAGLPA